MSGRLQMHARLDLSPDAADKATPPELAGKGAEPALHLRPAA